MIDGSLGLQEKLYNDAALVALLAEQASGAPALFNARLIPPEFLGTPVINYYRIDPISGGDEVDQFVWSVNCRAESEVLSQAVAELVYDLLRRTSARVDDYEYFFTPSLLATIPPTNEVDDFNSPVDVTVRARKV